MVGGLFVSHEKTEAIYSTMTSHLRKYCPELKTLRVFGTHGDRALVNGIKAIFPDAQHLLCDLHMRDNVESELMKAKVSEFVRAGILRDIFGSRKAGDKEGMSNYCIKYNTSTELPAPVQNSTHWPFL